MQGWVAHWSAYGPVAMGQDHCLSRASYGHNSRFPLVTTMDPLYRGSWPGPPVGGSGVSQACGMPATGRGQLRGPGPG